MQYEIEFYKNQPKSNTSPTPEKEDLLLYCCQKINQLKKFNSETDKTFVILTGLETKGDKGMPVYHAALSFTICYQNQDSKKNLEQQVSKLFETKSTGNFKIHVTKGLQRPPLQANEKTESFFQSLAQISKRVEVRVKKLDSAAATPLAYVAPGVAAIDGFGPVTGNAGLKNEYIMRDSLIDRSVLLAYLIYQTSKNFNL